MREQEMVQIRGTVEDVLFANPENGFAVIELDTGEELLPVVGELCGVEPGEELTITGSYGNHPKFGYQFKAALFERSLPTNLTAIRKYLASGAVKGIGPALAGRIVDTFGSKTLEVLEKSPDRLSEVKGISQRKAQELVQEFNQMFGMRMVMIFLSSHGLSSSQSVRVYKKWGPMAMDLLKANPYLLCSGEFGVEFEKADRMALSLNLSPDSPERVFGGIIYMLRHNLHNGHTCLAREVVAAKCAQLLQLSRDRVEAEIDTRIGEEELFSIQRNREYLFLPDLYGAERYVALRIGLMLQNRYFETRNVDKMIDKVEQEKGMRYEGLQREAIRQALSRSVLILTGGPGTGKTTTLNAIIELLEGEGLKLAIAAPTGRAAKRISEVTGREAKTVHRLLEVDFSDESRSKFLHNEQHPLDADAVVIDEMSMVDIFLFESLLRGIKMGCRLILVGDSDQLPSVGPGNVLRDLIDSGKIPTVELKQVFRQAAESLIVTNAHKIVEGEMPDLTVKDRDFFFLSRLNAENAAKTVVELAAERLPKSYGFSPVADIQVLAPQRKGDLGVNTLNTRLQAALNPPAPGKKEWKGMFYTFREGDKVLQTRNNYDIEWDKNGEKGMGVFNGDIGMIKEIDHPAGTIDIDFDDRICTYTFDMAAELELAYAVTVHKSQGSEYDAVILPILGGYDKLYFRNLLYTAVTRARKLLILVGSQKRIAYMVENNLRTLRYTGLKFFLQQTGTEEICK
ncbi:MAG TPA: ATP-dependent RecD-like DNA helicase [Candidatus Merdivicinus intestinigallinarum]|nr:ATP-dependent RecD-like DNA helicase [Candidatus Merdivicinus intestinigallinarum]